jgi:hypothetical protein
MTARPPSLADALRDRYHIERELGRGGHGDNQLLSSQKKVPGGVTVDLLITHATVEIDGQKIVEDGKLVASPMAQYRILKPKP